MPKEYLAIKKQYKKKGKSDKEAKRIAAATYNKYIAPKSGKTVGAHDDIQRTTQPISERKLPRVMLGYGFKK
jgi:hypothetical protein